MHSFLLPSFCCYLFPTLSLCECACFTFRGSRMRWYMLARYWCPRPLPLHQRPYRELYPFSVKRAHTHTYTHSDSSLIWGRRFVPDFIVKFDRILQRVVRVERGIWTRQLFHCASDCHAGRISLILRDWPRWRRTTHIFATFRTFLHEQKTIQLIYAKPG